MNGILRGLTENRAETDPTAPDDGLRGRTYAIPYEDVWQATTRLVGRRLRGWSMTFADDQDGVIEAAVKTPVLGLESHVSLHIGLDENAQTRVDAVFASLTERGDLGRSRRGIKRFFRRLDEQLGAEPGQILDPTCVPAWLEPQ